MLNTNYLIQISVKTKFLTTDSYLYCSVIIPNYFNIFFQDILLLIFYIYLRDNE